MYKRTLAFLLTLCMILSLLPAGALAAEADDAEALDFFQVTHINPLYADVVTEADLNAATGAAIVEDEVRYHVSIQEAADYMRSLLAARTETIEVAYTTETFENSQEYAKMLADTIFDSAVAHTGDPQEGDYLMWQHGGWTCGITGKQSGGVYYLTLTYNMTYYTDAAQEEAVDTAVDALLDELIVGGMTDYQKVKAAYDWICANVTYDNANLNDTGYKLKYTAYAALMNKTAVCQGYALLLYRLALEMGVDCRLIPGTGNGEAHGWNILELGDAYYNADATWDAGDAVYSYFLKSDGEFSGHTRSEEYASETFYAAYSMSDVSYVPTAEDEAEPDPDASVDMGEDQRDYLVWTLDNGVMTISGTGDMGDYADSTETPWYKYSDRITSVVIGEGITRIGDNAFAQCANLTSIQLAESVTSIGDSALAYTGLTDLSFPEALTELETGVFRGCTALTEVTIPGTFAKVSDSLFEGCTGLTAVVLPEGLTELGVKAFANCTALTAVDFPVSLKTIGAQALQGCTGLTELYFLSDAPSIGENAFGGVTADVYYPAGNSTWTAVIQSTYGGTINWVFYCPNGHDYEPQERSATCTEAGGTYYICSACGDTFIQNEVPALGHNYVSHVCTNCGEAEKVLPAPVAVAENDASTGKIRLSWEAVADAASYNVYVSANKYDNYTLLANVTGTELSHDAAVAGATYYYCVTAIDAEGKEFGTDFPEENIVRAVCALARPALTLSNVASSGKVRISWEAIEGAVGYEIHRSADGGQTYTRLTTAKADRTSVTNTSAEAGVKYRYKIMALAENSEANSVFSFAKDRTCDLPRPSMTLSNVESTGKVRISWDAVEGAVKYQVYRSTDGGETYTRLSTTAKTTIVNTSAEAGVKYRYKVRAVAENTDANSAFSSAKDRTCDLPQPEAKVSTVASSGKIRISWDAVEGAVKYQVYRSIDGGESYTRLTTTTKTAITNTSAEAGQTYFYKVRAVAANTSANSAYSAPVSAVCVLARPEVSVSLSDSGKPVVTWEAVDGAQEYEVYFRNSESGKYSLLVATTATGIEHVGAKAGDTCYYRVVAVAAEADWNSARSQEVFVPCVSVDLKNSETMEAVIDRINEYREYYGVEPLQWYEEGVNAARIRAAELQVEFSTERPDGGTCEELLDLYGLYYELDLQAEPGTSAEVIVDSMMSDEDFAEICLYEDFTFAVAAQCGDCWAILFGGENL